MKQGHWWERMGWLEVLVGGLVAFFVMERVLEATHNPNLVPTVILLGAFTAPVTFLLYVRGRLHANAIDGGALAAAFLIGGVAGIAIAGFLEYHTLQSLGPFVMFGVGLIEEGAKLAVPLILYRQAVFRSDAAGVLIGVASGMGFAAFETMGYGFTSLIRSGGAVGAVQELLLMRGLLSPAGHGAWTGLVCGVLWHERNRGMSSMRNRRVWIAFFGAVLLHALWDIFAGVNQGAFLTILNLGVISVAIAATGFWLLMWQVRRATVSAPPTTPEPEEN